MLKMVHKVFLKYTQPCNVINKKLFLYSHLPDLFLIGEEYQNKFMHIHVNIVLCTSSELNLEKTAVVNLAKIIWTVVKFLKGITRSLKYFAFMNMF